MARFRYELPAIEDVYALADWIETNVLLAQTKEISRAQLGHLLSGHTGITLNELETPISFLFAEIARRRHIAGRGYPLFIQESFVKLDHESNSEFYKFLLLISLDGPMRRAKRYKEIDRIFDYVVGAAAKSYFGKGTEALRFGWPASDGRPKKFEAALEWLSNQIGMPRGASKPNPNTKDGGVDVVAWKSFGDLMTAFMVVYIQCTVQSDWYPKSKDAIDRVWFGHIDTGGWASTALAIPFVVPRNYEKWDDLRRIVSIVFDRLRLTRLLHDCDVALFTDMSSWNRKELARFALA